MLIRLALKLCELSPAVRRLLWRRWYEHLASYKLAGWRFMNYGFSPLAPDAPPLWLSLDDEPNRFAIQLYENVVGAVPLVGLDVLEVGSGRGGGAAFIQHYLGPKRVTGLDFSESAIRFCRRTYDLAGLSFLCGDAESLPFGPGTFDAVIIVESSHCYGSRPAFLAQVKRVLRPSGHFLFADLCGAAELDRLHVQLVETGLEVLERKDFTAEVCAALRLDSERKWALIECSVKQRWHGIFREFAAIEGSKIHAGFRDGSCIYVRYLLRK